MTILDFQQLFNETIEIKRQNLSIKLDLNVCVCTLCRSSYEFNDVKYYKTI